MEKTDLNNWQKEFDKQMQELPVNSYDLYFEGIDGRKIETARMATIKQFISGLLSQQQLEVVEKLMKYADHYQTCILNQLDEDEAIDQGFEYKCGCGLSNILQSLSTLNINK